ncbi:GH3 family domain-containing protein [Tautonia plasticadhaerens]|uniref:GH3 auxin-responsive promoter n=1 Tax=Tautonia plasticadhaerens TaxID=2527974 RepID=A0A518GYX3_9BACT|nr:GH3 auxin-responsive promoter family protein [Tautonia plasticadhaerens]QDV33767.1 GH3 auxin-responsive promoter [Tautonia plasticadhaerens]
MSRSPSSVSRIAGLSPVKAGVNLAIRAAARVAESSPAPDPASSQANQLRRLLSKARATRFGRDHGFESILRVRSDEGLVSAFRRAVPLRTYEQLWDDYLAASFPTLRDVTWPGMIPYFALTSGTTQGATKYIPVSREMLASNRNAAWAMVRAFMAHRPDSRLFRGKIFFLGGTTDLETPAPGVRQGDLSAIASLEVHEAIRPYTFPPVELAHETDWDRKLTRLVDDSRSEPITLISGVPSWLLMFFERLLGRTGKATVAEAWPTLEVVVHGGLKFDPYRASFDRILGGDHIALQETYPCSEGFVAFGDRRTGLLRPLLGNGLFLEFVPVDELDNPEPTRHWLGDVQAGINYAIVLSTCAGMWAHVVGDTVRFESLRPPLLSFTGRTKYTLSAFGEHLISEEIEGAMASAAEETGSVVLEWHAGPVFEGALGHHRLLVEFSRPPADLEAFRIALDADLSRRNADYAAHRTEGVGLPMPSVVAVRPGGFADWMRSKGKLGGQHKVPRMDGGGLLTSELVEFFRGSGAVSAELAAGPVPAPPG